MIGLTNQREPPLGNGEYNFWNARLVAWDQREITRIWLTHKTNDPSKIVVNWMSDEPGDSVVRFGLTTESSETVQIEDSTTLHHVEIPLNRRDTIYHYSGK